MTEAAEKLPDDVEGPVDPAKAWEAVSSISINWRYAGGERPPIYVIKIKGGYLRATTSNHMLGVKDRRLATRFDSATWAATVATFIDGAKVKRLWTRAEREAAKVIGKTYVWKPEERKSSTSNLPNVGTEPSPPVVPTPSEGNGGPK